MEGGQRARLFRLTLRRVLERFPRLRYLLWVLQTLPLLAFWGVAASFSPERASRLGRWLLERLGPHLHKQRHVLRNLQVAFPEHSPQELARVAREVWGNLGAVMGEYPHLGTISQVEGARRLEIVLEEGASIPTAARPVVMVTAHLANWELAAGAMTGVVGIPLSVVYGPQENPLADRLIQRFRRRGLRCGLVAKEASMRQLVRNLREGRSLGLVVDQRVDGNPLVPFFGVPAATAVSPARLALRFGCDLVPLRMERLPGTRFRVTVTPPLPVPEWGSDEEKVLEMTRRLNVLFESWIREQPGEWMCTKRRWSLREVRKARAASVLPADEGQPAPVGTVPRSPSNVT